MSALNAPRELVAPDEPINDTEERFARTSRTRDPIFDDDDARPLDAGHEVAIYAACLIAAIVLLLTLLSGCGGNGEDEDVDSGPLRPCILGDGRNVPEACK